MEQWKPIPDFPGYEVSDLGNVRSFRKQLAVGEWIIADDPQRILSPGRTTGGRRGVSLRKGGETHQRRIAQLVMLAFVGPRPDDMEVSHIDQDCCNDRLDNLKYDTHFNNTTSHKRFLSKEKALALRYDALELTDEELAEKYGCCLWSVSNCRRHFTYRNIGGPKVLRHRKKLTDEEVVCIRDLRNVDGREIAEIAEIFDIHPSTVSYIARGLRRQNATAKQ